MKLRKNTSSQETVSLQRLIQRHAGVLGLSACVQAYPYDVPDFIPQVLVDLSVHVNDPQPIGVSIVMFLYFLYCFFLIHDLLFAGVLTMCVEHTLALLTFFF